MKKKGTALKREYTQDPDYTVYTDGGCARNPGGPGGIGVVIIGRDGGETHISEGYEATTNNRMEITAVIRALEEIPPGRSFVLYSDSLYVLNTMAGEWRKTQNTDLWAKLDSLCEGRRYGLVWVKGHNRNPYNELCDSLATRGINSRDKKQDTGYRAPACHTPGPAGTGSGPKKGAMGVSISVPDIFLSHTPARMPAAEYAVAYGVSETCAALIAEFSAVPEKKFKDYARLKTGGTDAHSSKNLESAAAETPDARLFEETVRKYLANPADANSAARWYCRGLSLEDAIRKALTDREISDNAVRYRCGHR